LQLTPALFNYPNYKKTEDAKPEIDYEAGRVRLKKHFDASSLESLALEPECLVYANGGESLAFTPSSQATKVAYVLEQIYAIETLTAQAVAVGDSFSLIELRFGVKPQEYWREDFANDQASIGVQASLFREVTKDNKIQSPEAAFLKAKTFGEVVKYLTAQRYRRRDFNPTNIYGEAWHKPLADDNSQANAVFSRQLASFDTFPLGRRCDSCDRRLAVVRKQVEPNDPNPDWLCEPCARKAVVGQMQRGKPNSHNWFDHEGFKWKAPPEDEFQSWKQRFGNFLTDHPAYQETYRKDKHFPAEGLAAVRMADDVQDISSAKIKNSTGAIDGFLGIVYGDGNNMGGLLQKIETPAAYRSFANHVFKTLLESVQQTLAEKLHPVQVSSKEDTQNPAWCYPFEVLSVGGDDLYLFVPASVALEVAVSVGNLVESKLRNLAQFKVNLPTGKIYEPARVQRVLPEGITPEQAKSQSQVSLSTGVLLAPESTPIFFMDDLVGQLLKSAKKKASTLRGDKYNYYGGTIDFMALKSITMISGSLKDWRKDALEYEFDAETKVLRLTSKPYTNWELEKLLATLRTLKDKDGQGPAKSQLYQLQEQLSGGELSSSISYLYLIARSKKKGLQLQTEINRWLSNDAVKAPWRKVELSDEQKPKAESNGKKGKEKVILETILADLMELYDFAPGRGGDNGDGGTD
jgi:CRISPR-associated protein Cmr2